MLTTAILYPTELRLACVKSLNLPRRVQQIYLGGLGYRAVLLSSLPTLIQTVRDQLLPLHSHFAIITIYMVI
jgi:hypothetical protein